jgi:hypothetical protein
MWWQQGDEIAALRTDLVAAYTEVEALRARPVVVSPPAPLADPALESAAADPNAVVPAGDAPDAARASSVDVVLVPAGSSVDSAVQAAAASAAPASAAAPAPAPAAATAAPPVESGPPQPTVSQSEASPAQ